MNSHALRGFLQFSYFISIFFLFSIAQAQDEPDTIKLVSLPVLAFSNTYIGDHDGLFAEQNIAIEYVSLQTTNDATSLAALLAGEVDVIQASLSPGMINSVLRGET